MPVDDGTHPCQRSACRKIAVREVSIYRPCCGYIISTTPACADHPGEWEYARLTLCPICSATSRPRALVPRAPATVKAWLESPEIDPHQDPSDPRYIPPF